MMVPAIEGGSYCSVKERELKGVANFWLTIDDEGASELSVDAFDRQLAS